MDKKEKKPMSRKKKILLIVIGIIAALAIIIAVAVNKVMNDITGEAVDESQLSQSEDLDSNVINIALFGIDGRTGVSGNRSDTIMVISLDMSSGTIKVCSVMRDTYVRIPASNSTSETYTKINAAYAYGGPQLAIQTLNENFDLNIGDYVTFDFSGVANVVDTLGGVDVNVESASVMNYMNEAIDYDNQVLGRNDAHITTTGTQHLNGGQALAYSRVRYSDSDYYRTDRQREIVEQVFNKLSSADTSTLLSTLNQIYPYIKTSLNFGEITSYATKYMNLDNRSMIDARCPFDGNVQGQTIDGASCVVPVTLIDNAIKLHQFIYGNNVDYTPSQQVTDISNAIVTKTGLSTVTSTSTSTE